MSFVTKILRHGLNCGWFDSFSDEAYIKLKYRTFLNKKPNLRAPVSFNEKLQWLKLHDRKEIYSSLVDKASVKELVGAQIGEEYIIPTLGVWNDVDGIDLESLPDKFVLKATHDSGGIVICKDKASLDWEAAKDKLRKSLSRDYYLKSREWPYKNVQRRIMAEQYMETVGEDGLNDYKFFCFNGNVEMVLVCKNRFSDTGLTEDFFSKKWEHLDIRRPHHPNSTDAIPKPEQLDLMLELSERLAGDISFVRVDFYEINLRVYFGEMTFFPASGFEGFEPEGVDEMLGDKLVLTMDE